MRVHDRLRLGTPRVDVAVKPPLGGGGADPVGLASRIDVHDVARLHRVVRVAARGDEEAVAEARAHVPRLALREALCAHAARRRGHARAQLGAHVR